METREAENFRKKSILVICWAGSDRSKMIADELNARGYFAEGRGVMRGHNYVTKEDLLNVGTVVFSSINEKRIFDRDKKLHDYLSGNKINVRVLNITESDKNRAYATNKNTLIEQIKENLDKCGLNNIKKRS